MKHQEGSNQIDSQEASCLPTNLHIPKHQLTHQDHTKLVSSPKNDSQLDKKLPLGISITPNLNESHKNKQIFVHSVDQVQKFDLDDNDAVNTNFGLSSQIPKPTGLQQLNTKENTLSCQNDIQPSHFKYNFDQIKIDSLQGDPRTSPPKSMIGSGIGQGSGLQKAFNLRGANKLDSSHQQINHGGNIPVSQINLNSNSNASQIGGQQQNGADNNSKSQTNQANSYQSQISQRKGRILSPRNIETLSVGKSQHGSKSLKQAAMFSSVTSPHLNQNQISDLPNLQSDSHFKQRERIDQAYQSLNKDEDSDQEARNNSISRCSSHSNHLENQNPSHLFENQQNSQDNVKVCIRVRPLNHREQQSQQG